MFGLANQALGHDVSSFCPFFRLVPLLSMDDTIQSATSPSSGRAAKAKTSRTLRAKRRREERTETAMGEPASNLPVGIRKLDLAVLVLLLIVWVGLAELGVWLGNLRSFGLWIITIAMEAKRRLSIFTRQRTKKRRSR